MLLFGVGVWIVFLVSVGGAENSEPSYVGCYRDLWRRWAIVLRDLTNWVTIYDCAQAVKTLGASPVMAHAASFKGQLFDCLYRLEADAVARMQKIEFFPFPVEG